MDKSNAAIAIVCPVYNRADIVMPTLRSFAAQTLRPLRIILVDNASTDDTLAVLQQWAHEVSAPDFTVDILQCATPGAAAARNAGLEAVAEPWTMFFDSDDIMPPTHAANVLRQTDGTDIVGWNVDGISDGASHRLSFLRPGKEQYDNLFHGGMATQRWAARTALLRKVDGWNPQVRYWDDIELGARLLAQNPSIRHLGDSGIKVMDSATSITRSATGRPEMATLALQSIEATLSPVIGARKARLWCITKLAIECGIADREGQRTGLRLLNSIGNIPRRAMWAYRHTRAGLPGAARILHFLHLL